jgi:hypothetical protein
MPFAAALQPEPLAGSSSLDVPPHVLGVVFPGYHRDEFNDLMWGRGYTEWWRVGRGKALIPGQHQPQLPRDQYDLSELSTLQDMAAMAHETTGLTRCCSIITGTKMRLRSCLV